ncbi:MAG: lytic transglycosylase domain-containing protein [SAR324 cluster bacterium]|uniref:Lytic transglycosylase domain-containing protein n=1 Tax=SAR324 cluster bacterium TaxID=2024889 RepID=A0A7X9IJA9_9DELT|nr:lytic transglycosylase domain-containing protein [SAR324 cluster bacterium]
MIKKCFIKTLFVLVIIVFSSLLQACSVSRFFFGSDGSVSMEDRIRNARLLNPRNFEIRQLPDVQLLMTPEVEKEMRLFVRDRGSLRLGLRNRKRYLKMMKEVFRDEGVPSRLINLAFVESKYQAAAESSAGAVGVWQFMKDTAVLYGLEINFSEDQRKDPILSTIAAARYLYDLYVRFNDWYLALAAYNRGPSAIEDAMRRTGAKTFFELARSGSLCSETRRYVYKFLAISIILEDYDAGIKKHAVLDRDFYLNA